LERTVAKVRLMLGLYVAWLGRVGIEDLRDVDEAKALAFAADLDSVKALRSGRVLSSGYQAAVLSAVRDLHRCLVREGSSLRDPFRRVRSKRKRDRIPFAVLTVEEVDRLISCGRKRYGPWGGAIIQVLYDCGLRLSELIGLTWEAVRLADAVVEVRGGKNGKDRLVAMPSATVAVLAEFGGERAKTGPVFSGMYGGRLAKSTVDQVVRQASWDAKIEKKVSPHVLRHSYATHLLQNGVDIRLIQELLGHESIQTTEIYTRVEDAELERVYRRTHPRG
jgi:site-specific recombinase XerD